MSVILTELGQFILGVITYTLALFAVGWVFGVGFTLGQEVVYKAQSEEDEADA